MNGATVGIIANAMDADATNNTITYSLDGDAAGRFAVDPNTGVITVADGSRLDYETTTSYSIAVRATSSDGSTALTNFTIAITNVNEIPRRAARTL